MVEDIFDQIVCHMSLVEDGEDMGKECRQGRCRQIPCQRWLAIRHLKHAADSADRALQYGLVDFLLQNLKQQSHPR